MESWQSKLMKATLLLVTSPAWVPFLRALWKEANESMADEGGLLGRDPTAKELEEIREKMRKRPDPMVHEPLVAGGRAAQRQRNLGAGDQKPMPGSKGPAQPPPKPGGFR
ncbi:MAG: hypothetical protein ACI8X5_003456 [Planctomycetota bacterium]|jgi:hypothetical protein